MSFNTSSALTYFTPNIWLFYKYFYRIIDHVINLTEFLLVMMESGRKTYGEDEFVGL